MLDQFQQTLAQVAVVFGLPFFAGFEQYPGQPHVGVAGGIVIDDAPVTGRLFAPQPGGQPACQITVGEVVFGPAEDLIEGFAVVGNQRVEQRIGLRFRCGACLLGIFDHAAIGLDESMFIGFPLWPG